MEYVVYYRCNNIWQFLLWCLNNKIVSKQIVKLKQVWNSIFYIADISEYKVENIPFKLLHRRLHIK